MAARCDPDRKSAKKPAPASAPVPAAPVPAAAARYERLRTYPMTQNEFNHVRHVGWRFDLTKEQISQFQRLARETKHNGEPFRGEITAQPFTASLYQEGRDKSYHWFVKWSTRKPEPVAIVKGMYVQGKVLVLDVVIGAEKHLVVMTHTDVKVFSVKQQAQAGQYGALIDISELKIKLNPIAYHAAA